MESYITKLKPEGLMSPLLFLTMLGFFGGGVGIECLTECQKAVLEIAFRI